MLQEKFWQKQFTLGLEYYWHYANMPTALALLCFLHFATQYSRSYLLFSALLQTLLLFILQAGLLYFSGKHLAQRQPAYRYKVSNLIKLENQSKVLALNLLLLLLLLSAFWGI